MRDSAEVMITVIALIVPVVNVLLVQVGGDPARALVNTAGLLTYLFALRYLARHPSSARFVDALFVAIALCVVGAMCGQAWVMRFAEPALLCTAVAIPVFLVSFAPWRPSYALAMTLPTTLGPMLVLVAADVPMPVSVATWGATGVAAGAVAAIAAQMGRREWAMFDRARISAAASESMATLGRLTAGISHELKTPLAATLNQLHSADALVDELKNSVGHPDVNETDLIEIADELKRAVHGAESGIERAAGFVRAVREHTQGLSQRADVEFSVAERVAGVRTLLSHQLRASGVTLSVAPMGPSVRLFGDPSKFDQILTNLISNATAAYGESGGSVRVTAEVGHGVLTLSVADDGPGIPDEIASQIFEPFFTTRAGDKGGTGLGLSIARDIAASSFGGTLRLAPSETGARFELRCPVRSTTGPLPETPAWRPGY